MFNTNRLLIWRLKLKNYGPNIENIEGNKNKVSDTSSRFPINRNQETTHESTYKELIVLEINDTGELS